MVFHAISFEKYIYLGYFLSFFSIWNLNIYLLSRKFAFKGFYLFVCSSLFLPWIFFLSDKQLATTPSHSVAVSFHHVACLRDVEASRLYVILLTKFSFCSCATGILSKKNISQANDIVFSSNCLGCYIYVFDPLLADFVQGEKNGVQIPITCMWTSQHQPAFNLGLGFFFFFPLSGLHFWRFLFSYE